MLEQFSRTALLVGAEGMEKLSKARVAVFGIGGVGGYVVEALARSGIGEFDLIDNDVVSLSNLNRQIMATLQSVGRHKVDVMKERILSINPDAVVHVYKCFYLPETAEEFDFSKYDYVVDAVDTVTAKIDVILQAQKCGVPVMSSMGAGNKMDPTKFQVADIYKTSVCPLAKVMRKELKYRGVKKLKVVYSTEEAMKPLGNVAKDLDGGANGLAEQLPAGKRAIPGSIAFVPSVAGLIIASEVIKDLLASKA
jgi:tRNA A37 threonylcarbamoyladenosine dehydratase